MFFNLSSVLLGLLLAAIILGSAAEVCGSVTHSRESRETVSESFGVLQSALLGFMALILAFGLSLAVGRYQDRRGAVVDDANAIGTDLPAGADPARADAQPVVPLLVRYTDAEIQLSHEVPGSSAARRTVAAPVPHFNARCGDMRRTRSRRSRWRPALGCTRTV